MHNLPFLKATFVVSQMNDIAGELASVSENTVILNTFERSLSLAAVRNFLIARKALLTHIRRDRPAAFINLMPHLWTPLLRPAVQSSGIPYITVAHDFVAHPGDATSYLLPWFWSEARHADMVITLSKAVAEQVIHQGKLSPSRVLTLFHPDLRYQSSLVPRKRNVTQPLKLLFLGRVLKYKGLPLLVEAVELLHRTGVAVSLGVAGEGRLGALAGRLSLLGAEVINRWLGDDEITALLRRYDAIALCHIEASQSGVAATAFGHCMPVVSFPVGGIAEQTIDGQTGVLAKGINAAALAEAILRLVQKHELYDRISARLSADAEQRSMVHFASRIASEAVVPLSRNAGRRSVND